MSKKVKILILGSNGMIGHELLRSMKLFNNNFEVKGTLKKDRNDYNGHYISTSSEYFFLVDVFKINYLIEIIKFYKPDVIINCIGITKQKIKKHSFNKIKYINSIFPHELYKICNNDKIRLIHLSTDCVFSGDRGEYCISDIADANDIYGKTKKEGEIVHENSLTIRKSTIGYELSKKHGLLEWFLKQKGDTEGYKNAIFTGISTIELSRFLSYIISDHTDLGGIMHLRGPKIDKYSLLKKIKFYFGLSYINLIEEKNFYCNRSLKEDIVFSNLKYSFPNWDQMIKDLSAAKKLIT